MFTLDDIFGLVGTLDDTPGDDTPRQRFRRFLRESVGTTSAVRDYVETCVRNKGAQYDHALQDLVNHSASLIGFHVEFGRYRGVPNEIGHDGLWHWNDFTIVAEVKTTDAYSIKTSTLVGYVDRLISEGRITSWDRAMGLYVVARTDAELTQLANSIIAEKRTHQLRVATVDAVLSLAELEQDGQITPDEAVALLRPAGVFVADTVRLLARIAAKSPNVAGVATDVDGNDSATDQIETTTISVPVPTSEPRVSGSAPTDPLYIMTPVRDEPEQSAKETIQQLVGAGWYVFGESTPGRKRLRSGDRICFYESGVGVVAEAEVASQPEKKPPPVKGLIKNTEKFPWSFKVRNARFFFNDPVVIDASMRSKLEAFAGRDLNRPWAWFVQGTKPLTEHDFSILTTSDSAV